MKKSLWPIKIRRAFDKRRYLYKLIEAEAAKNGGTDEEAAKRLDIGRGKLVSVPQYYDDCKERDPNKKKRQKRSPSEAPTPNAAKQRKLE
jgi:hypothetical protein